MKRIIKRTLPLLLMLVTLVTMLGVTAFAAPSYAHLAAGEAVYSSLTVGSEVKIPVSLTNLQSGDYLAGFYCHLDDTEYLTVDRVEFTTEIETWLGGYNSGTKDINKVQMTAADDPSTAKHDDGLLFTVVYTVAKEISAGTSVNPSISGVSLSKTSKIFLNTATPDTPPTAEEKAASIVYPENGSIYVPEAPSFTVVVDATPTSVVLDDTVTVTVKVTGGTFTAASYSLTYETDKFELITKDSTAVDVGTNGFKAWYLDTSANGSADGTVIGTYTFKALAQDTDDVVGYFTLSNAGVGTFETAADGQDEIAATVSDPAAVTIGLAEGLTVSADDVVKTYDGNAYGVTAEANKTGAEIRYMNESGDYTLTTSPTYSEVGTYTVNFKATLKGYKDATGSATVTINAPEYVTETPQYVAGYSLVLVYTNVDNIAFTYDGHTMYDVSDADYLYNDETEYKNVYGVVVKGAADMTKLTFTAGSSTAVTYSEDVNGSGKTDLQDAVATVGVYNARTEFMKDARMMMVLRADVDHDKKVDSADTNAVLNVVKNG